MNVQNNINYHTDTGRYARCIEVSKRIRWEIEKDVIRGRSFDRAQKFLPDGLAKIEDLDFLTDGEKRLLNQIQGRTYANIFGLVERFINAKVLEVSRDHWLGDQTALEALVRFSDEELKHQEMFRRIDRLINETMPEGYIFVPEAAEVATAVLSRSTWAVLGLTCHIELFTQAHYKQSIEPDSELSDLYKDVFLFHWREESQHAVLDELEWRREHERLGQDERDRAVDDLIALVVAVDGILQQQSEADANYFCLIAGRSFDTAGRERIRDALLRAYRWQYILSGVQEPRFSSILDSMVNDQQADRIGNALCTLV